MNGIYSHDFLYEYISSELRTNAKSSYGSSRPGFNPIKIKHTDGIDVCE